jgi:hypothetical protein
MVARDNCCAELNEGILTGSGGAADLHPTGTGGLVLQETVVTNPAQRYRPPRLQRPLGRRRRRCFVAIRLRSCDGAAIRRDRFAGQRSAADRSGKLVSSRCEALSSMSSRIACATASASRCFSAHNRDMMCSRPRHVFRRHGQIQNGPTCSHELATACISASGPAA